MNWRARIGRFLSRPVALFPNEQFESLSQFHGSLYPSGMKIVVRVWRTEASIEAAAFPDRNELMMAIGCMMDRSIDKLATEIGSMPRISCVAITDESGNGLSYYPNWH